MAMLYSLPSATPSVKFCSIWQVKPPARAARCPPRSAESDIYGKLLALIRHPAQHGIDIETLMHKALDRCDPEPPFSRRTAAQKAVRQRLRTTLLTHVDRFDRLPASWRQRTRNALIGSRGRFTNVLRRLRGGKFRAVELCRAVGGRHMCADDPLQVDFQRWRSR